jgi:hypothetical protein
MRRAGFQSLSLLFQIDPHIGLVAAMAANRMAFGFAFLFRNEGRLGGMFFMILQRTGDHHFSFIPAIFALTDVFEFFLGHRFLLLFQRYK